MICLLIISVLLVPFPTEGTAGTPIEIIQEEVGKLIAVLKAEIPREKKEKKIWSIADGIFDYTQLSKRTLARNWRSFSPDQRKEFTRLFSKLLGEVYLDRIMAYRDEKVVFEKQEMFSNDTAEVFTRVIARSKEVPIRYRMTLRNGNWKIYDVVVEGVSLVGNYRSQFKQILLNASPEDLLETLRKKVEKM
jgi:phospholipid transport system substrate-binding protein